MYCHIALYTVFSLISSLNFYINYSRAVLHIPSNPIPCIVFVLPYIPVLFYIYPLLPCIAPISPSPSTYTPSYLSYRLCYLMYPLVLLHIPSTLLYRVKETDLMLTANGLVPARELDSSHLSTSPLSSPFPRINAFC